MERIEQTKIEKEAKQILDKFAKALEKVDDSKFINKVNEGREHDLGFYVEREEFERKEIASSLSNENSEFPKDNSDNFKQRILENAPSHDEDFIIAEKGGWKK